MAALLCTSVAHAQFPPEPVEVAPEIPVGPPIDSSLPGGMLLSNEWALSPHFEAQRSFTPGYNFITTSDFKNAFAFPGTNALFKIGGYVKLDAIYDFNAIDSQDLFDPGSIPVNAMQRTNTRFHARQTRLNIDSRWPSDFGPTRVFVEGDFFGEGNAFRLRHAYGEVGQFLAGQTWTTFTDHNALPQTIDNQGGVAGISTRRAQIRYTNDLPWDGWKWAVALEDSMINLDGMGVIPGATRTPTPDLVARIRMTQDWGQFQVAGICRKLGFQPLGQEVQTTWGGGMNFSGWINVLERDKFLFQVVYGQGIGSFRDLPDGAPDSPTTLAPLHTFAWMTGYAHSWNERLTTNVTFNASQISNTALQAGDSIHRTEYMAVNLIWNPADRIWTGIEYLYGTRTNLDGGTGDANRLQIAFVFELP